MEMNYKNRKKGKLFNEVAELICIVIVQYYKL